MLRYSITRPTPAQVLRRTRARRSTLAGAGRLTGRLERQLRQRPGYLEVLMPRFCSMVAITLPSVAKKASLTCSQPPRSAIVKRLGRRGELVRARDALDDRAVALGDEDLLGLGRVEEVVEGLGRLRGGRLLGHRQRVLDEDRLRRDDVLDVLAGLLRGDRLVLVGEQHVALAADERLQRLTRALVLHGHVVEEVLEVGLGLVLGLALLELGAVGGHDVPLGAAGGERVRLDDLDARLGQVGPAGDALGIALADDEDDDRLGHEPVVLVLVPVGGDEAGVHEPRHVGLERELDDVGRQAGLHAAALLAGRAVGLVEGDVRPGVRLLEGRDQLRVRLARRRVGDERDAGPAPAAAGDQ